MGDKLDSACKYANHAAFICTILIFSGAIPGLIGMIPMYLFYQYLIDRVIGNYYFFIWMFYSVENNKSSSEIRQIPCLKFH